MMEGKGGTAKGDEGRSDEESEQQQQQQRGATLRVDDERDDDHVQCDEDRSQMGRLGLNEALPVEIIGHVLSLAVRRTREWDKVSLVCRLWHDLVRSRSIMGRLDAMPLSLASGVSIRS